MRRFFTATFLMIFLPTRAFASVGFVSLLPNPAGDDTLGEYIELRNRGCESRDISGYILSDASGKSYVISNGRTLPPHENQIFSYSETKIALNNSSDEAVYLKDTNGNIIDEYHYSGTQKDNIVLQISTPDDTCSVVVPEAPTSSETGQVINTGSVTDTGGIIETPSSTGWLSDTGGILESTGDITGTGGVDTGSTGSTDTGSTDTGDTIASTGGVSTGSTDSSSGPIEPLVEIYTETGALTAISLVYDDRDGDHLIDTLEILYPYELTGSADITKIYLFSRTGGLSSAKINTATGLILSGTLSGNLLILTLLEGDIEKDTLHITNSTTSDLRLKSSGDLGFRSRGGQVPTAFFLTSSFDEYRLLAPKHLTPVNVSGIESASELSSPGGTGGIHFPEVVLTLQSPTNATLSGDVFTCTTSDCRINLTLEPIFSSGFVMKDYVCLFGTGGVRIVDSDCNPNTIYYTHSGSLEIELQPKSQSGAKSEKIYRIDMQIVPSGTLPTRANPGVPDVTKPVAILEHDAKWKEYYEQVSDYELNCFAYTCSLNFTAEKSYDPDGDEVRFLWIYDYMSTSTSKDPGARKLPRGDHVIVLRVIDKAGNYDEIRYIVHVLGPKPKEEKVKITEKKEKVKKPSKISATVIPEKRKVKKIRMVFFSPPEVILQGKTGKKVGSSYICEYKRVKHCSLNLALTGTTTGFRYDWSVDGVIVHTGKNPKAWKLTPGVHTIQVTGYRKGATIAEYEKSYTVRVLAAPSKPKKSTKTSSKKTSSKNLSIVPTAYASEDVDGKEVPYSQGALISILLFSGSYGIFHISRRRYVKNKKMG